MERSVSAPAVQPLPFPRPWPNAIGWLAPLWRHGVWLLALFVVTAAAVAVRLDVQALRNNIDRQNRLQREATVLQERLRLESAARRQMELMEGVGAGLALSEGVRIVAMGEAP